MGLIDADRLKEEIVEAGQRSTRYRIGEFWELNRNEIWKVIDEQPTVQPERNKGRWEMLQIPITPPVYKCSVCGSHALQTLTGCLVNRHYESNLTKFCPNCGADMRKENES